MIYSSLTLILLASAVLANRSNGTHGRTFSSSFTSILQRTCSCGWSSAIDPRIVNGKDAEIGEFPSMVALKDMRNPYERSFCGATIVARRYILTASHCLGHVERATNIAAIVGTNNLENPTESRYYKMYMIQRWIRHNRYDIAILVTFESMVWTRGVGPACMMPLGTQKSFEYENVVVVGFGTSLFGGPVSKGLRKITLRVTTNEQCQAEYEGFDTILPSQMCAYDYSGRHRDTCQFDSGGPVYRIKARQHLIGIISRGKSCAESAYAMGVNTRVTSFLNWIRPKIQSSYCPIEI